MKTTEKENSQHIITVVQGKTVLGKIYREFDNTTKKEIFFAKDAKGNPVFTQEQKVGEIIKELTQQQKEIQSPEAKINNEKESLKISNVELAKSREFELIKLREQKPIIEKKNELGR